MDPQLCQFIENEQNLLLNYDQLPHVNVNDVLVDMSCSIGPNAVTPPGLDEQPPSYPEHSKYRFATKYNLSPSHLNMVFEMYNNSVPNSQITNIMSMLDSCICAGLFKGCCVCSAEILIKIQIVS